MKEIITATTFQLIPRWKGKFKSSYNVGDPVWWCGKKAYIVSLNEITGNCRLKVLEGVGMCRR